MGAAAEIALSAERDKLDGEAASWSVAEGGENRQLTAKEYNAMRADYDKCEVVYSADMDENGGTYSASAAFNLFLILLIPLGCHHR